MNTAPEAEEAIYLWSITPSFIYFALGDFPSINMFWFVLVSIDSFI